uniref:ADP-ribosylhydrolase ARH3 n=1 Tax=Arcella intermedia TaxID=1963864 RepID=A0A6B2L9W8_9EUKA|eukprot:TRINITY_DN8053_c0_g2_i3.p1 TRINITY_DN8053_c0_g2~~TRINITY_DN8053_c0_g2_i3.p1  ORF type:complete len:324 (-),score=74.80 TRINITY_DN8053_c0_g2_i3:8-979(-)
MGLCLADSLISCNKFDGVDLRFRFHRWWSNGYCNGFGWDSQRKKCLGSHSVGLGGNISLSIEEFMHYENGNPEPKTGEGDRNTSGNGSVMRNAAVPIFFHKDMKAALYYADEQSRSTHQGDEAGECCQLMTFLIVTALQNPKLKKNDLLGLLGKNFKVVKLEKNQLKYQDPLKTVVQLCCSEGDWKWKDPAFKYKKSRAESQPGYVGSYAMDAVAMSLHCVYTTESFTDCMLKCVNLRGDSDSVSSVAGQIAGAIYGFKAIPKTWIYGILQWDRDMFTLLRAYKLYKYAPNFVGVPEELKTDDPISHSQTAPGTKGRLGINKL